MPKDNFIRVRVSNEEKEIIRKYCEANGTNISNLIRYLLFKEISKGDKDNE